MTSPATPSDASLDDLRALTLRRLAALRRLAGLAVAMAAVVNQWFAAISVGAAGWGRVGSAFERVWRAIRLIEALDGKLRDSLRLIDAGIRPPEARVKEAAQRERPEASERPDRPDHERPETFGLDGFDALLKRPLADIISRILNDLSIFPAWRALAEAALTGEEIDPEEVAATLASPIKVLARPRPARPATSPLPPALTSAPPHPRPAPA